MARTGNARMVTISIALLVVIASAIFIVVTYDAPGSILVIAAMAVVVGCIAYFVTRSRGRAR